MLVLCFSVYVFEIVCCSPCHSIILLMTGWYPLLHTQVRWVVPAFQPQHKLLCVCLLWSLVLHMHMPGAFSDTTLASRRTVHSCLCACTSGLHSHLPARCCWERRQPFWWLLAAFPDHCWAFCVLMARCYCLWRKCLKSSAHFEGSCLCCWAVCSTF